MTQPLVPTTKGHLCHLAFGRRDKSQVGCLDKAVHAKAKGFRQ